MSSGPASGGHLDLDALADVLAGDAEPAHVAGCATCRARLAELEAALTRVSGALAGVDVPEPPADLGARLARAVAAERGTGGGDVLPLVRRTTRWLPALGAVAAAAALVTGGVLVAQRGGGGGAATTADRAPSYALNETGTNYSRTGAQLEAALPDLLKGSARLAAGETQAGAPAPFSAPSSAAPQKDSALTPQTVDLLAPLRTTPGLATCLASLTDPSDTGLPLALDYATFEGKPALVVVLPTSRPDKVDVFVVPPGCARADGNVLYFRRLPKP